jgi:hypothetical protein
MPNRAYDLSFNGATPSSTSYVLWRGRDRWVELVVPAPAGADVTRWGQAIPSVAGAGALANKQDSAYYYDAAASALHIKIFGNGDWEEIHVDF